MTSPSTADPKAGASTDRQNQLLWVLRVIWFVLPAVAGPLFSDALVDTDTVFRRSVLVALWSAWGLGLLATLVPHPISLTAQRIVATAAVPFALWALIIGDAGTWAIAGVAAIIVAAGVSMLPDIAARFIDGESYGDERRLPLRPPAGVLLGPLPVAWLMTVIGLTAGPLMLADQRWIIGGVALAVGVPLAVLAIRSLHTLTRRFLVFVPAGFVVHDLSALTDPVLFRREDVQVIGPAFADSIATDLTLGSSGLALEARFTKPLTVPVRPTPQRGSATSAAPDEPADVRSVLVSPSQPGVVLAEAERRRLPVG